MHFHQLNHRSKKIKSENKVRTSKSRFEAVQYFSWTSLTIRKKYIVLKLLTLFFSILCLNHSGQEEKYQYPVNECINSFDKIQLTEKRGSFLIIQFLKSSE